MGPRPRGTVNLSSCRFPIVAGRRGRLGRGCRGRALLLSPSTSRVVALPTEKKQRNIKCTSLIVHSSRHFLPEQDGNCSLHKLSSTVDIFALSPSAARGLVDHPSPLDDSLLDSVEKCGIERTIWCHASYRGSGVRGRLQAIDDRENFVHPVVCDEVDRPLSTEVTMRAE